MLIKFEQKDDKLFFSMVSSHKIFGELAEKLQKEDLDIPLSTVDILISKLTEIILQNKFYQITFEEDYDKVYSMISFMLGVGIWKFNPMNNLWDLFIKEAIPNAELDISKEMLWDYLLKNGLEI